jgi:hypothetical protein
MNGFFQKKIETLLVHFYHVYTKCSYAQYMLPLETVLWGVCLRL